MYIDLTSWGYVDDRIGMIGRVSVRSTHQRKRSHIATGLINGSPITRNFLLFRYKILRDSVVLRFRLSKIRCAEGSLIQLSSPHGLEPGLHYAPLDPEIGRMASSVRSQTNCVWTENTLAFQFEVTAPLRMQTQLTRQPTLKHLLHIEGFGAREQCIPSFVDHVEELRDFRNPPSFDFRPELILVQVDFKCS